ncbi:ankyrin repeat domain-containing protein SOWAHC-like [Seriola dumerili]|uniref:ankyrin repeat domain-containing protein SOWAHC-like n=1 Tax=Seriola dumerili TaxID=41447 RepID=UPI000BBE3704|nr:ankyrin repeat domain-containing protein SOWAHC-like [Seriola dumerili]
MEFSQEAIVEFVRERGGRVRNTDLTEHFKAVFPEEQERKAASRERFKNYVDNVAFVKAENGVKYVCLRRRFRGSFKERRSNGTEAGPEQVFNEGKGARGAQAAEQQTLPGSGYGSDSQVRAPPAPPPDTTPEFVCTVEEVEVDGRSGEMGNTESFRREKRESKKEQVREVPDIPEISVIEASPLPAEASVFTLPGPAQTGSTGQVDAGTPTDAQSEAETHLVIRRRGSKGSQRREPESDDEGHFDTHSLCGSDGTSTPKSSRKHFIEVMMNTSPQVRRSMVFRRSVHLSSRSDSDSASLVSTNLDDDGTLVTLDPLEHEWMMCASDAEWGSLRRLLNTEPSLVLRKDFVTGFTCLHWAAKHGKPELIALIINFAKQHNVPISVDVRSNTGYTPLHIAAMHNHMEVVKLLVGAYSADLEIRDYSGRKACQYLTDSVSLDIRDIIGAYEQSDSENVDHGDGGRWRFSKVLQSNLKPLRLLNPADCDSVDGEGRAREKPLRRKSSLSRMKPKLEKLRLRTSQIVHSTSFRGTEDLEGSARGSFRARPKTHFFG